MKFADISYTRADFDAAARFYASAAERLSAAGSFEEAEAVFLEVEDFSAKFDTALTVANIRHDIDTRDEFYDAEVAYIDEHAPELEEYVQRWQDALLKTPYRAAFEEKYNRVMFLNAEIDARTFSPEIVPELQRENALTTEYSKLLAGAQIPFEGGVYTLSQLTPIKQDADASRRAAAWAAEDAWYAEHAESLDAIYAELVTLRDKMGRKLGHDGYIPLGYDRMQRNCYDKADVERFRAAVVDYIVPIAYSVYETVAKRLGKSLPMGYADCAMWFTDGNARPVGTPEDILEAGRSFYHELSGETAEFIDHMLENGMMDVLSRPGKAGGGYCTTLTAYKTPYIFANFNGTSGDVEVITHEAGHAFASWTSRDIVPAESSSPSLEGCEVHSMSMEFFAEPWAERFFGADADKFRWQHLADAVTFIPYGTLVDHFQHECYEHPEYTPEQRNAAWSRLAAVYMPWLKPEESLGFYSSGRAWQRQRHIYISPFYYIDYCLAQTVSLEFWAMIKRDKAAAWEKYMAYTRLGGTLTFRELLDRAGLDSPFEPETLKAVAEAAKAWLDANSGV
ncbi:MAG TPA: M3 family oligoendopeptidase [Candidatus Scatomorpha pullicola]|nr:M3 family oligoendopeptidase [Candidatus Scatomorpha pullicola]